VEDIVTIANEAAAWTDGFAGHMGRRCSTHCAVIRTFDVTTNSGFTAIRADTRIRVPRRSCGANLFEAGEKLEWWREALACFRPPPPEGGEKRENDAGQPGPSL
jgi:hypothetical protein